MPPFPVAGVPPPPPAPQPPKDGHDWAVVRTGPNPGRYENIDAGNIIDSPRTRGHYASPEPSAVYARLAFIVDDEPPVDGTWEEESLFVGVALPDTPRTYAEAMASPHKNDWSRAMTEEFDAFEAHDVFLPSSLPHGAKALGTTWVYTIKTASDGSKRYKARLVAQGFAQRPGVDVNETFAPVVRTSTIHYILAIAAFYALFVYHFDFNRAFLNGKLTEDVFIRVPLGYPGKVGAGQVLKLIGAMYGTKQAPREWHRALDALMVSVGYISTSSDSCVFTKTVKGISIIIAVYVDDGLVVCKSEELIKEELEALNRVFTLKVLGPVSNFLSMEVEHVKEGLIVHHSKYIRSILDHFGFVSPSRARASTPMDDKSVVDTSPPFADITLYQSAVGSLMFTATYVRADIAVAVCAAAQKVIAPSEQDWQAVKRIFMYLSNTVDLGILYKVGSSVELQVYSDASWADDIESRKSVGGYIVMVAGGVVSWRSKQQSLVATSTTESELLAASDATKEAIAFRHLAADLGNKPSGPTIIYEDNQAAISISENPSSHGRTKHFDVAQLFVRQRVQLGDVVLKCMPTNDMVADAFTKALSKAKYEHHRSGMGFVSLSSYRRRSVG
ncbi:hypothetical protein JCM6882_004091 [Rhodosporidiobolus microsporus]